MDNTLGIVSEIIVLIFNILIYMELTVLKKDNKVTRVIMYLGRALRKILCKKESKQIRK